ncbi:unnamed protein product [Ilex paraguariensis]
MPHRNSSNKEPSSIILRRSPRFLQSNQTDPKGCQTPKAEPKGIRFPYLDPPFLSSTPKVFSKKTPRYNQVEISNKSIESDKGSKISGILNTGRRRSTRLSAGIEGFSCLRRSSRFSEKGNIAGCIEKIGPDKSKQDASSDVSKSGMSIHSHRQFTGGIEKRVTRSSKRGKNNEYAGAIDSGKCNGFSDESDKNRAKVGVIPLKHKAKLGANLSKQLTGKSKKRLTRRSYGEDNENNGREQVGVKRKRNEFEESNGTVKGWTLDQELTLQRAYFAVKPTPHFWTKVARLVPGKSAQDCFDKIHSDHLTALQPRSRTKKTKSSSLSPSASKLLDCTEYKIKKARYSKWKIHLAQKTVRELLQKQCQSNQDYEADLFSVLEPTINPSVGVFQQGIALCTPERDLQKPGLKRCQGRSSSAHKKHLSRFSGSSGATLVSPPILKQIKNKALHEKYIDLLHCREAKRKAAVARAAKSQGQENRNESHVQKMDATKAAKNALVFDATDAINQFRHLQANTISNFLDSDHDEIDDDEDEGED